jgi:hypothetical protein
MPPKLKKCKNPECNNEFLLFNSLKPYCSPQCEKACVKRKHIKKVSDKRKVENKLYSELRIDFLSLPENQICFIKDCYEPADTIEHLKGRKGYADQWARDNKITLYLDVRFWAPCCLEHNLELEKNPELSKQYQLSKLHGGKKL